MRSIAAALMGGGCVVACLWCAGARADRLDDVIAQIDKAGPPPESPPLTPDDFPVAPAQPVQQPDTEAPCAPRIVQVRDAPTATRPLVHYHEAERDPAWIGSVGLRTGPLVIDGVSGHWTTELVLQAGVHLDRFTVLGEYGGSLVHHDGSTEGAVPATSNASTIPNSDQTTDGVMHRLGLYGRYALARGLSHLDAPDGAQSITELYVQLGGGLEVIQWDLGGRLVRPELSATVGLLGAHRAGAHSRHGMFLDTRFQVARRIDRNDAAPTCSAPCTQETPPVAWSDRSIMLEAGFVFGR
jgi:hypothetical protein